jgi:membrane-associated HD superfamily phosphohydrolase
MQVLLNKKEKQQLVVDLHRQNKTIREIAQQVHMSFKDIGSIIRSIDGHDDDVDTHYFSNKSKATRALYLFKTGKKPIDVAIELDLPSNEVDELQQEFWALNQLPEVALLYDETKNFLSSFLKLYHYLKDRRMLSEEHISKFLRYANHDLPQLTNKIQQLTSDVIDLEFKKKQSKDIMSVANTNIAQLRDTSNWYQRNIELKRQILADLDTKINHKMYVLREKPAEDSLVMKQARK